MRIELQWVEFERGNCAVIPVATTAGRPALGNQLIVSRFAMSYSSRSRKDTGSRLGLELVTDEQALCHNDTGLPFCASRSVRPEGDARVIPVAFGEPVVFDVPVVFKN